MNDSSKNQPDQPQPQPADRLEEHELKAGETVQIPQPKRLTGMPIESAPTAAAPTVKPVPIEAPPVESHPRMDLSPNNPGSNPKFAKLSDKQKKAFEKLKKMRSHKHWHSAKILVITVLVFLLLFNSQWIIAQFMYYFNRPAQNTATQTQQQNQSQSTQPNQTTTKNPAEAEIVGPENVLIVPKINVRAPIIFLDTNNEAQVLIALRGGVVHYAGTANPGENGNAVLFGHSSNDWWEPGDYKYIFVNLERLAVGDTYEIHYNSRKYVYQVQETKVVEPNDLSVLNQTSYPSSTLITCTPPGTSWRRFVVSANQIEPDARKTVQTQPAQQTTQTQPQNQNNATLPSAPPSLWDQIVGFFTGLFGKKQETKQTTQPTNTQTTNHLPEVN